MKKNGRKGKMEKVKKNNFKNERMKNEKNENENFKMEKSTVRDDTSSFSAAALFSLHIGGNSQWFYF